MTHLPKRIVQIILIFILLLASLSLMVKEVGAQQPPTPTPGFYGSYSLQDLNSQWDRAESQSQGGNIVIHPGPIIASQGNWLLYWAAKTINGCMSITCKASDFQTSAIGSVASAMSVLYTNPPADFGMYAQDFLANAGLAKPVFAQGIGFTGLSPLLPLWKTVRNVSYAILVIVMVSIGFMIIFRMKLDPKTVISVQAALPKIILTLILITFSYAIAGFLIDVMYIVIAVAVTLMNQAAHSMLAANTPLLISLKTPTQDVHDFLSSNVGTLMAAVFHLDLLPVFGQNGILGSWVNSIGQLLLGIGAIATIPLLSLSGTGIVVVAPFILLLPLVIIFLGLLFTFIRLLILLFNSYIQILVSVILAPILLLQEAIPGKSAFSGWILNLVANLSVFPATIVILYFSWLVTATTITGNLWTPPLLGYVAGGDSAGIAGSTGNPISVFLGLGILFLAPTLVVSVKKIFAPKPVLPITAGTAFSPLTGAVGTGMGAASQFYYMQQIFSEKGALAGVLGRFRKKSGDQ